ncbi:class I SAM-dependent methyltransferase [Sulfitobacter sp. JB4-11]|uniref:class I SAM-dependent methyltransferase n=1 Tax=Sulfitobacter rhodophyticola TaxID=3238304 RepID=UPI0035150613
MTSTAKFWDKIAPKYAKSPIKDMVAYEYTLGRTRSYLSATDRVLEIGCGTGSTALLLADSVQQITGTDISPAMIGIASDKARAQSVKGADFAVATARQSAQRASGHDAVLGFNIFHLTQDYEAIIADLQKALAPGALFISKTPCLGEPSIGLKRFAFRAMIPVLRLIGIAPFVRSFSFAELEGAIEAAGFDLIETGSFPAMSRYIVARRRG